MNTQQPVQPHIPEGYLMNHKGDLVRVENIKEQDQLRDQLVNSLAPKAVEIHDALAAFKKLALQDIEDLVVIAGERYNVSLAGKKGNVTMRSFDGRYKIQRTYQERVGYTEEIEAAKALFDSFASRLAEGADPNIKVIINNAFRTNRNGEISVSEVLRLMRYEIVDDEWDMAVKALRDAMVGLGKAVYLGVFERIGDTDQYRRIPLDIAAV